MRSVRIRFNVYNMKFLSTKNKTITINRKVEMDETGLEIIKVSSF